MPKKKIYSELLAIARNNSFYLFSPDRKTDDSYPDEDKYLKFQKIDILGLPALENEEGDDWQDIDYDRLSANDYFQFISLATITGTLILVTEMEWDGFNSYDMCDDVDADLGHTISVLKDLGMPLNEDPYQNVFYIQEIEFTKKANKGIQKRIILELPQILFRIFNLKPEILAYIPANVGGPAWTEAEKKEREAAIRRVSENMEVWCENETHADDQPYIAPPHVTTEKDFNILLGRRMPEEVHETPLDHRNFEMIEFYSKHGFEEIKGKQLLIKQI